MSLARFGHSASVNAGDNGSRTSISSGSTYAPQVGSSAASILREEQPSTLPTRGLDAADQRPSVAVGLQVGA
ncbi:hypothetical protein HPB50_002813 [Hyalomma asiaticum]|uniref:Uncharacterized protein n=1 Tax=Hyalomma asiaticum TaxID=266040 RepID=A0ACB7TE10_HYAAI|nr:hypothetical protein HPB50_002813 [Hyalomma asiaticum]